MLSGWVLLNNGNDVVQRSVVVVFLFEGINVLKAIEISVSIGNASRYTRQTLARNTMSRAVFSISATTGFCRTFPGKYNLWIDRMRMMQGRVPTVSLRMTMYEAIQRVAKMFFDASRSCASCTVLIAKSTLDCTNSGQWNGSTASFKRVTICLERWSKRYRRRVIKPTWSWVWWTGDGDPDQLVDLWARRSTILIPS